MNKRVRIWVHSRSLLSHALQRSFHDRLNLEDQLATIKGTVPDAMWQEEDVLIKRTKRRLRVQPLPSPVCVCTLGVNISCDCPVLELQERAPHSVLRALDFFVRDDVVLVYPVRLPQPPHVPQELSPRVHLYESDVAAVECGMMIAICFLTVVVHCATSIAE